MTIKKAWLGYTVYGILLTAALLYVRFPSELLTAFIRQKAAEVHPGLELSVDGADLSPSLGVRFRGTGVSLKTKPGRPLFRARDLLVRPEVWSLFRGGFACRFEGSAYGGDLRGRAALTERAPGADLDLVAELSDIRIVDVEYLQDVLGRRFEGLLAGRIAHKGRLGDLPGGSTEADLKLTGGRLEYLNLHPMVRFEPMEFKEIRMTVALNRGNLTLKRVDLKGPQFSGTLSGTMSLEKEIWNNRIELKGSINPSAAFLKGLSDTPEAIRFIKKQMRRGSLAFAISGTLREPKVNFL